MDSSELAARMAADLAEIERYRMPFGRFGPKSVPPDGTLIYELPVEYLEWFMTHGGFPKGRLGELLRMVHQMKMDGSGFVFDAMRARNRRRF